MMEDVIISTLQEIKSDQKAISNQISNLSSSYNELKSELAASRNGYQPHEIVELLHWVEREREKAEKQSDNVKRALTTWIVPVIGTMFLTGLILFIKK